MYKLKYYYLSKEEKKELKNKFYQTELGIKINHLLLRLIIIGIIGILYSIYLFIFRTNIYELITSIILLIISLIFILSTFKIRINKLNAYLVKKK